MMKGFATQKTLDVDVHSNPTASDQQACLSSIPKPAKKKTTLPGNLDPNAEVIALSPKSLLATNKFVCEVCGKGFQRDQNLQLHRRGHNLPWKLKQRPSNELVRRKIYICPEPSCSSHDPSRALADLTGIKKHFFRKHGEKRWSCDKCSKRYAVLSDWKAHSKICGSKEYRCDCGTIFSRRDRFVTHKAFCEVLAAENYTSTMNTNQFINSQYKFHLPHPTALHNLEINNSFSAGFISEVPQRLLPTSTSLSRQKNQHNLSIYSSNICHLKPSLLSYPNFSATALSQKAAEMAATISGPSELHDLFTSNSQKMNNGFFGLGSAVSSPLQFQSFPSCSEFVYPFEEAMGGQAMNPKREHGSGEDLVVARNIEGEQAGKDETTRDFLGLRVALTKENMSSHGFQSVLQEF